MKRPSSIFSRWFLHLSFAKAFLVSLLFITSIYFSLLKMVFKLLKDLESSQLITVIINYTIIQLYKVSRHKESLLGIPKGRGKENNLCQIICRCCCCCSLNIAITPYEITCRDNPVNLLTFSGLVYFLYNRIHFCFRRKV